MSAEGMLPALGDCAGVMMSFTSVEVTCTVCLLLLLPSWSQVVLSVHPIGKYLFGISCDDHPSLLPF